MDNVLHCWYFIKYHISMFTVSCTLKMNVVIVYSLDIRIWLLGS